jgi:hypothetical protein
MRYKKTLNYSKHSYRSSTLNGAVLFSFVCLTTLTLVYSIQRKVRAQSVNNDNGSTCKAAAMVQFEYTDLYMEGLREIARSLGIVGLRTYLRRFEYKVAERCGLADLQVDVCVFAVLSIVFWQTCKRMSVYMRYCPLWFGKPASLCLCICGTVHCVLADLQVYVLCICGTVLCVLADLQVYVLCICGTVLCVFADLQVYVCVFAVPC